MGYPQPVQVQLDTCYELLKTQHIRQLAKASLELGYYVEAYPPLEMIRVSFESKQEYLMFMSTPLNTLTGYYIAHDKFLTNTLLSEAQFPVPDSIQIVRDNFIREGFTIPDIHFPVVAKPNKGTDSGEGVITNITDRKQLLECLHELFTTYPSVMVEQFYTYKTEYRVLVLDDEVIAITQRIPAYVIGDGVHSIEDLIIQKNKERAKSIDIMLKPITIDRELLQKLHQQELGLKTIPKEQEYIQLKNVANSGAGGESYDATDHICAENKELFIRATTALGLRLAGFDVLCEDIAQPIHKDNGVIIEVNHHPGITCHIFPQQGKPRHVAHAIMRAIFA